MQNQSWNSYRIKIELDKPFFFACPTIEGHAKFFITNQKRDSYKWQHVTKNITRPKKCKADLE